MKKTIHILFAFCLMSCVSNSEYRTSTDFFEVSQTRYKIDDSQNFAKTDLDTSDWSLDRKTNIEKQIFWTRNTVLLKKEKTPFKPLGITIHVFGAYELYWDNVLIGTNDKPGFENKNKKIGAATRTFVIPDKLAIKGNHIMALRRSQFHESQRNMYVFINDYETLLRRPLIKTLFIHILAGVFLITSIYYFLLFINDRKKIPLLLFSGTCLLFFLLVIIEYIRNYIPIHYTQFYLRLKSIGILTLLISFLVPYYFAIQFSFINRKWFLLVYSILLLSIFFYNLGRYDATAKFLGQMMWMSSTIIISHAIYQKKAGSIMILMGLILSFVIYKLAIYDISLFVSFSIILLCMFYILSIKLKEQKLAYDQSIALSTRLKYELLKKKIQPHFLMNTLTSLIDWIEEAPKKGIDFIEALAIEFDLLNQVENKTIIPLSQEIELCKSHLNIMAYRKEINYQWNDRGITDDKNLTIPPAVIHTLLENGITHCLPLENNSIQFKLIVENNKDEYTYTFIVFAKVRNSAKEIIDGTGIKYIKARLTESYGDQWSFSTNPIENGWKNIIKFQNKG